MWNCFLVFSGTEGSTVRSSRISDFGALEQSLGFRIEDAVDISRSTTYSLRVFLVDIVLLFDTAC